MRSIAARAGTVALGLIAVCSTNMAYGQYEGEQPEEPLSGLEALDADRLSPTELAARWPGAEFASGLPRFVVYPALQVRVPYQILGFGATVEGMPLEWLRLSALYSVGISPTKGSVAWSNYAEAAIGVRLLRGTGEDRASIRLEKKRFGFFTSYPDKLKVWVPSHHALFIEGGALTGFSSLETCSDCAAEDGTEPPADNRQLVIPFGGLRYVYGYDVGSRRQNLRARVLIQAYAHLLVMPLNAPEEPRYFPNGDSAGPAGFGGRVGIMFPPFWTCIAEFVLGFGCLDGNLAVGYAPYPRIFLFELQIGSAFY